MLFSSSDFKARVCALIYCSSHTCNVAKDRIVMWHGTARGLGPAHHRFCASSVFKTSCGKNGFGPVCEREQRHIHIWVESGRNGGIICLFVLDEVIKKWIKLLYQREEQLFACYCDEHRSLHICCILHENLLQVGIVVPVKHRDGLLSFGCLRSTVNTGQADKTVLSQFAKP